MLLRLLWWCWLAAAADGGDNCCSAVVSGNALHLKNQGFRDASKMRTHAHTDAARIQGIRANHVHVESYTPTGSAATCLKLKVRVGVQQSARTPQVKQLAQADRNFIH